MNLKHDFIEFSLNKKIYSEILYHAAVLYNRIRIFVPFFSRHKITINKDLSPFFIIGAGRSGNTLLRRILDNHSVLFIPPEIYVLGSVIKLYRTYKGAKWNDLVSLIYSKFELYSQFETLGLESLAELKYRLKELPKDQRSLDNLINSFYLFYAEKHGIDKVRWGDKTPFNVFSLKKIISVFPNAYFIHIIRNPFDSVHSYVKAGIYEDFESAALRWVRSVALSKEFGLKNNQYIELFYEDLVTQTEREINRLCDFLKIPFEPSMLKVNNQTLGDVEMREHHSNVKKEIFTDGIGKGLRAISKEDKIQIIKVLNKYKQKYIKDILSFYNIDI